MALAIVNTSAVLQEVVFATTGNPLALGYTPTQGNYLYALMNLRDDNVSSLAGDVSSIAQTNFTWAPIGSAEVNWGPNNRNYAAIWRAVVPASPGTSATFTFPQGVSNNYNVVFIEVSGLAVSEVDRVATNTAAAGSSSITVTAGGANAQNAELVLTLAAHDQISASNGMANPATGYTSVGTVNSALYPGYQAARKTLSASETSSAAYSGIDTGGQGLGAVLVTLKELSGLLAPRMKGGMQRLNGNMAG